MRYEYCPKCGKKLIPKQAGDDGLVPYCEDCEKYWFDTFGSCVIIMVVRKDSGDCKGSGEINLFLISGDLELDTTIGGSLTKTE